MKKYLITLSAFAVASTASAYFDIFTESVLENKTVEDNLLWKGNYGTSYTEPTGNVYVNGVNSFKGVTISGTGGLNVDLNFVLSDNAQLTYTNNAFNFNDKYTDISYNLAENATSAKVIFNAGQNLALSSDPNNATDTRSVTIGSGVNAEMKNSLTIQSDATNTTNKFVVNGTVNVAGAIFSKGNAIIDVNGKLTGNSDFSDNSADEGGVQLTINNGGSVELARNATFRDGTNINIKKGTMSLKSFTTEGKTSISVAKDSSLTTTNATLSSDTSFDLEGTATVNGAFKTTHSGTSTFNVAKDAELTTTGDLYLQRGVTATIDGKINCGGEFLFNKDGTGDLSVAIGSTAEITTQRFRTRSLPLILTSGAKLTINNNSSNHSYVNAGNGSIIEKGATLIINTSDKNIQSIVNHAALTIKGTAIIDGGKWITTAQGGIVIDSDDVTIRNTNIAIGNNGDLYGGKLQINQGRTFNAQDSALLISKQVNPDSITETRPEGKKIEALLYLVKNSTTSFKGLAFYQTDADLTLTITLEEGAKLILTDLINNGGMDSYGTLDNNDSIIINNFAENAIAIKNYNSVIDDAVLEKIEVDGIDQLFWIKGENGYYWLSATAVPEPAEWAMILGSLALGFAIYRRRK